MFLTGHYIEQMMERMLREKQEIDQSRHEQLISALCHSVSQSVSGKLDKVMKSEMKQSVVPGMCSVVLCCHVH